MSHPISKQNKLGSFGLGDFCFVFGLVWLGLELEDICPITQKVQERISLTEEYEARLAVLVWEPDWLGRVAKCQLIGPNTFMKNCRACMTCMDLWHKNNSNFSPLCIWAACKIIECKAQAPGKGEQTSSQTNSHKDDSIRQALYPLWAKWYPIGPREKATLVRSCK